MHNDSEVKLEDSNSSDNSNSCNINSNTSKAENIVKNKKSDNIDNNRRKRINRIKIAIILVIILLLLLPSICCIVLLARVNRLQKQVDHIASVYGINQLADDPRNENYAYAAVKSADAGISLTPTQVPSTQDNIAAVTQSPIDKTYTDKTQTNNKEDSVKAGDMYKKNDSKSGIYAGKKIYLTFDDGPSRYTGNILDVLDQYHVKATFFVIGKTDHESKELYRRIVKDGHTLGMHSYSHEYDKIYNSVEDFDKDFTKLWKLLYDTTGYKPTIYRFPGGSDNLVNENGMDEFVKYLNDKNIVYFDWNVVNGDATSIDYSQKKLVDNVLDGITNKDRAIVLLHDSQTKESTVDSLPELLKKLIAGGAQLLPLDKDVKPIQMLKADSIK